MKIKVIHISHCSYSYFLSDEGGDLDDLLNKSWVSQVVGQIKKFHPEIEGECWFPERMEKKERSFENNGTKLRIFPTTFSPMYALDFSLPLIKALKEEVKECHKQNKKLIIHIHEYHSFHGLLISTLFSKEKIVAQNHGGHCPWGYLQDKKSYRPFFLLFMAGQIWEKLALKNVNCFYALSQKEIQYLKKITPHSKIRYQTMGIEDSYFDKIEKKIARKKLNLNLEKKIILYMGRISQRKGIHFLLDAMENLKDVELKIAGDMQEINYFKNYAKEKAITNVEFLGGIFGEKKLLYLSSADALILPSLNEGAPVVLMEAIAKNVPVVSTGVGGIPLMIKNKREGVIIKTKSSEEITSGIQEVLKWKKKNIQKYAEKYRWKKIIDETVKDYQTI
jgi:glycosyltransferase involved in cell wall biosynthesis